MLPVVTTQDPIALVVLGGVIVLRSLLAFEERILGDLLETVVSREDDIGSWAQDLSGNRLNENLPFVVNRSPGVFNRASAERKGFLAIELNNLRIHIAQ